MVATDVEAKKRLTQSKGFEVVGHANDVDQQSDRFAIFGHAAWRAAPSADSGEIRLSEPTQTRQELDLLDL